MELQEIFTTLQNNLKQVQGVSKFEKKSLAKKFGYFNIKKFETTIEKFVNSNLFDWITEGHYDLVNDANSFLKKGVLIFLDGVDEKKIDEEIKKYLDEVHKFEGSYIFVNTNFKRTTQPIFVLAFCEGMRRIRLKTETLIFKDENEILEEVSKIIKSHYKENNGELKIWGKIVNYRLHLRDKTFIFNPDGSLENIDKNFEENRATLKYKGRTII